MCAAVGALPCRSDERPGLDAAAPARLGGGRLVFGRPRAAARFGPKAMKLNRTRQVTRARAQKRSHGEKNFSI